MTPAEFAQKWKASTAKERSASQEHFIDLCRMLGYPTPNEADPTGSYYAFEKGAEKSAGGDGFADVWKKAQSLPWPGLWATELSAEGQTRPKRGAPEVHPIRASHGPARGLIRRRSFRAPVGLHHIDLVPTTHRQPTTASAKWCDTATGCLLHEDRSPPDVGGMPKVTGHHVESGQIEVSVIARP